MKNSRFLFIAFFFLITQSGCTAIKHRNLETQLQLQQSVFISPDSIDDRPVYLRVSNQTGKPDINFDSLVTLKFTAKGYKVTKIPKEAGIRLLVNFVYLDKAREGMSLEGAIAGGFGGALIGGLATQNGTGAAVGAAAGAGLGGFLGIFFPVDTWYGVVDVQIEEPLQSTAVRRTSSVSNQELGITSGEKHGSSRGTSATSGAQSSRETSALDYNEIVNHKKTQTRIVAEAIQTNIDETEASRQIREQLADSIANFL
ncbi:MAG TPA: complement resistance protein TraT [Geobacteraceae bacterium]